MNANQKQLVECLLDLAKRADELGEKEMARSMLIMSTATMTGESKVFKEWCVIYANAALERALKDFTAMLTGMAPVKEDSLDKNNKPDKQ